MELDVNLSRKEDEAWGFRLIGGTDFKMPLTVVKVLPESPAEKAGLQNGDTLSRIGDKNADDLSHDDARLIVDSAEMTLNLGVKRGLYDPVLDNYEPIYEDLDQIERADIDQPSQPTEVLDTFQIQQFLDPNQDIFPIKELTDTPKLSESRSLTASPFVHPTKPYRPFSTEPFPQIPPLEDPIILNPNYRDEFGKLLDGFDDLKEKYESKFKLPISEQYDPNWEKNETERLEKNKKGVKINVTNISQDVKTISAEKVQDVISEKKEQMVIDDIAFVKKMKKEIDLDKIEMTATSIVDESIERARTVAEEIKKEIDVELSDVTSALVSESKSIIDSQTSSESKTEALKKTVKVTSVEKSEEKYESMQSDKVFEHEDLGIVKRDTIAVKESKELNEASDKSIDEIKVQVSKKVEQYEAIEVKDRVSDKRKKHVQEEVKEVIETGSVRRKSMIFDKEESSDQTNVKSVDINTSKVETDVKNKNINKVSKSVDQNTLKTKVSDSKTTSSAAEHRAYTIGLKTIPNIRGTVHSSYHYNLLLQTFFLHLTDVMVALSRFILSEPVFNKAEEKNDVSNQHVSSSTLVTKSEISKKHEDFAKASETKSTEQAESAAQQEEQKKVAVQVNKKSKDDIEMKNKSKIREKIVDKKEAAKQNEQIVIKKDDVEGSAIDIKVHKKAITGLEMAQLSEKKSEELTVKMDAVISEFENKTGIEEVSEQRRRSRSRSQVVEEVMKESDPLEWLSKVDSQKTQEITEFKSLKDFSNTVESISTRKEISNVVQTAAEKKIERRHGSRPRSTTPNEGKQMYVAIVESHVYTNKDTILLDQTEISETESVQSIEDSNIAIKSTATVATESTTKETFDTKENKANVIEDTRKEQVSVVIAGAQVKEESERVVEKSKEVVAKMFNIKEEIQKISVEEEITEVAQKETVEMHETVCASKEVTTEQFKAHSVQSDIKAKEIVVNDVNEPKFEVYENKQIDDREKIQKISVNEESIEKQKETVEIHEIVSESLAIEEEHESQGYVELAKEEFNVIKEEQTLDLDISADIKIDKVGIKDIEPQIESAALKIVKEQVIEVQPSPEILESEETKVLKIEKTVDMSEGIIVESDSKFVDISASSSLDSVAVKSKAAVQESTFTAKATSIQESEASFTATSVSQSVQESSFIAKSAELSTQKLTLRTDIAQQNILEQQSSVSNDENNNIDTPTPSTVPLTPLTDEYVFKLQIPLPKTSGKVIPLDLTPEIEEDPHIVKKKLVPHIDTTLESPIIYDPPLPSPPGSKVGSPVYTKPGLRGGNFCSVRKEEILEIERKSTLLASAIDETIKSIEEYKEQVGMETKKEESIVTFSSKTENYSKQESSVVSKLEMKNKIDDEWSKVDKQVEDNNRTLTELSKVAIEDRKTVSKLTDLVNGITESNKFEELKNKFTPDVDEVIKSENGAIERVKDDTESVAVCEQDVSFGTNESKLSIEESVISAEQNQICDYDNSNKFLTNGEHKIRNVIIDVGSVAVIEENLAVVEEKEDPMKGFRPVVFNPEPKNPRPTGVYINLPSQETGRPYTTPTGELLGTHQGIVDGLEEATVDEEVAKELGKPGMTEDTIAELISGESEMLREAHVMGLTRVLTSHMSRADDGSSVDFKKIKPLVESLKDSEVLKALNDELMKTQEEKKKEERKWTTFMQKPKRAVPKAKFGYYAYVEPEEQVIEAPYKVKIVKQPKPKVAPDYKPENFNTGPLPWEERALNEPPPPPVEAEEPILVPEEIPEFLEAVDPLPESEVPDLEETGIPLPPPKSEEEVTAPPPESIEEVLPEEPQETEAETQPEKQESKEDMENRITDQLMSSVQNMVDPNASLEQQLAQMRAQLAALAQLPGVIQQTLELVTKQLSQLTQQESIIIQANQQTQQAISVEQTQLCLAQNEVTENHELTITEETAVDVDKEENVHIEEVHDEQTERVDTQPSLTQEEMEKLRKEEEEMLEEQRRIEKQKKEMMEQMRQDQESRQIKQRSTPRVGKPKPVFGNGDQERPLVLPGGRRWRGPKDAYNDQFIAETLSAQAEVIQGKAIGMSYESDLLPYDERINFLKYEKPPVSLDHLQHSDVYKLVHNMDQTPMRRVDMLTPVVAEADYREKCRSISPCVGRMAQEQHQDFPQQVQP